ncbi:MAG: hypothetical protein ACLFUI_00860 [Halanaerobiales bacterium]
MIALNIIKKVFVRFYDNLFKMAILNLIWFSLLILPFLLSLVMRNPYIIMIGTLYLVIIAGPVTLSAMSFIDNTLDHGYSKFKDFFNGIKENFKRGLLAFLFSFTVYLILVVDIVFFLQGSASIFLQILTIFFFYIFIVFTIMQVYYWGLLTIQKDVGLWTIIKRSLILVMDNIVPSILIFLFLLIIVILHIVVPFLIPLFLLALISLTSIIMTRKILEKYAAE